MFVAPAVGGGPEQVALAMQQVVRFWVSVAGAVSTVCACVCGGGGGGVYMCVWGGRRGVYLCMTVF